jgi:delta1-piperideine-2-carboxylate reductase
VKLSVDSARELGYRAVHALGYQEGDDEAVVEHLIDASLRGHLRFGLPRLIKLSEYLSTGEVTHGPVRLVAETSVSAQLDGGGAVGYVVAHRATALAVEKAREHGIAVVGATHTRFTGMLSFYCEMATSQGFVAICTSSAHVTVAPYGTRDARLGTNPVAIGLPGPDHPVILDLGTSAIMSGDTWLRAHRGEPLPEGVAVDAEGQPTTDAAAALKGAILVWGGHRGSALSTIVQLLGGVAGSGGMGPDGLGGYGLMMIVLNLDKLALTGLDELLENVGVFQEHFRTARPAAGVTAEPRMPFERSAQERARSLAEGIDLPDDLIRDLERIAAGGAPNGAEGNR